MLQLFDTLLNGPSRYALLHYHDRPWLMFSVAIGAFLVELGAAYLLIRMIIFAFGHFHAAFSWALRRCGVGKREIRYTFLQLVFPADTTKSAYATEQLHIVLRSVVKHYGFWERLAGRKQPYSLELVATKDQGIRYLVRVPEAEAEVVSRTLLSFLPGLKVSEADDYMTQLEDGRIGVAELRLGNDFVLSLTNNKALAEHDPIAYLTGHMRSLGTGEVVAFQVVTAPLFSNTHPNEWHRIRKIQHHIALNHELGDAIRSDRIDVLALILKGILVPLWVLVLGLKFVAEVISTLGSDASNIGNDTGNKRPKDNPYSLELAETVKAKLDQHLFEVTLRVLVVSPDAGMIGGRLDAITASFQTFASSRQSIRLRRHISFWRSVDRDIVRFRERALSPHLASWPTILSSAELSDLYHFPNTDLTKTEGLVKSRSRDLPAPLSQKREAAPFDVVVGRNLYGGQSQNIGVSLAQRQKHTYVLGKTGTGKTTMLMSMVYQDMVNGKGLAVLDPHGDMFRELLRMVPEHRRNDVVVFDPSDRDFPVGLNILDPGIEFDNDDDKHEWITSTVLSVFAKLADENQWGPRMEHILRNTTLTALQTPNPSLYTLQRLLTDRKYQRSVAKDLGDPILKQFWDKEFKMMGAMQMSSATAPLTHRLGHFITAKMSRHILLQPESTLRIADIMNEGKILLVNLSKGDIGEDQSFFFGTILTSFMWMAAYQRTKIAESKRRDFFVYVDEFQNFATPQFGAITSEGRKFHVSLIVSHQTISQMPDKDLVRVVAGNAATMICLKASPEDEAFILPYMKPEVEKGDIVNLPPYHFYMKVTGDEAEDAFSGQTRPLEAERSDVEAAEVIAGSRERYTKPKAEVEAYLNELLSEPKQQTKPARKAPTAQQAPHQPALHDI